MSDRDRREVDLAYVRIVHETADAVLFEFPEGEVWIPRSQIVDDDETGTVVVQEWIALEKGLI